MKKTISTLSVICVMIFMTQCKKPQVKSERCNLQPDPGICEAVIPKYYFDKQDGQCKEFYWGGCGGLVPFDTKEECEIACGCIIEDFITTYF